MFLQAVLGVVEHKFHEGGVDVVGLRETVAPLSFLDLAMAHPPITDDGQGMLPVTGVADQKGALRFPGQHGFGFFPVHARNQPSPLVVVWKIFRVLRSGRRCRPLTSCSSSGGTSRRRILLLLFVAPLLEEAVDVVEALAVCNETRLQLLSLLVQLDDLRFQLVHLAVQESASKAVLGQFLVECRLLHLRER